MKQSNLLKIASLLLIVAMMFSAVPAFAALGTIVPSATNTNVVINGTATTLDFDGVPGTITLGVYGPDASAADIEAGTKFITATQFVSTATYSRTIVMPDSAPSGTYTVVESVKGEATTTKTFAYVAASGKEDVVIAVKAAANANDVSAMEQALEDYAAELEITELLGRLSAAEKTKVAEEMINMTALDSMPASAASLPIAIKAAQQATLLQALNAGKITSPADLDQFIGCLDNAAYVEAFTNGSTLGIGDTIRTAVLAALNGKNIANVDALNKAFVEQLLIIGTTKAGSVINFNRILNALGNIPELTNFAAWKASSNDAAKNKAANDIMNNPPTSVAGLNNALALPTSTATPPPVIVSPGGGGGGSVGGGGISVPTGNKVVTYTDIGMVGWASDAIIKLTDLGVFNGYEEADKTFTFRPNASITREEFVKALLVCTYGKGAELTGIRPTFTDAQNGWYAPFLDVAEKNELTLGKGDGTFGIGELITRQDLATMVYRMLVKEHYNVNTNDAYFTDGGNISAYAFPCVSALSNAGVVTGYEDGSFGPYNNTTRAEAAVMLFRACKLIMRF